MDLLLYLLPVLTAGLAFGLCYRLFVHKTKEELEDTKQEFEEQNKRFLELSNQLDFAQRKAQSDEEQFVQRLHDKEEALEQRIHEIREGQQQQLQELKERQTDERQTRESYFNQQLQEQKESFEKRLKDQQEQFNRLHQELRGQFQNLATDILEEKSKKMGESNERNLNELLKPLKEKLQTFENQVRESYDKEARERFSMQKELKSLLEMNQQLSSDAQSLAQALKGDSKTQGDWGEMVLERILEQSGLQEGREYFRQMNIKDENNKNLRPDFVIQYPGERYLVIDSKVSLRAYESYRQAETDEEQQIQLKKHLDAIRVHIQQLSDKKYDDYVPGSSLDFVLMFMPVEGAFLTAMQFDKELWNHAFDKRILLISPTNLITAMRMITTLWKHDDQNRNVLAIAEESGKLYDKFVGFVEDLDKVDGQLAKARGSFDDAYKKLSSGRGNLVGKAENLKKLGAKTKKSLPQNYVKLAEQDPDEE